MSLQDIAATRLQQLAAQRNQRTDAAGLTLFADEVVAHLDPRAKPHQLDEILSAIANTNASPRPMAPAGGVTSSLLFTASSNSATSRLSIR